MKTKTSTVAVRISRALVSKARAIAKARKQTLRVVLEELLERGLAVCLLLAMLGLIGCGMAERRAQLRAACQGGDQASCIDYQDQLVRRRVALAALLQQSSGTIW